MTKKKAQLIAQHPVRKTRRLNPLFAVGLFFRRLANLIKRRAPIHK
jgi:hypothetical protein